MTNLETTIIILATLSLITVNLFMFFQKEPLYESKYILIDFFLIRATILLPVAYTFLQLYVFTFKYVYKMQDDMFHNVMFCYIGYLMLVSLFFFIKESQVNLLRLSSVIFFCYQSWMSSILINKKTIISYLGNSPYNPFAHSDTIGIFLCALGPILSFLAILTVWHYWFKNGKHDFA